MTDDLEIVASWGVTGSTDPKYKLAIGEFDDDWLVLLLRKCAGSYDVANSWHVEDEPETSEAECVETGDRFEKTSARQTPNVTDPNVQPFLHPQDILEDDCDD